MIFFLPLSVWDFNVLNRPIWWYILNTLGRYPIHFHMCEDVDQDENTRPWIKHNSIHHSNSRCVTVHGTHGLIVSKQGTQGLIISIDGTHGLIISVHSTHNLICICLQPFCSLSIFVYIFSMRLSISWSHIVFILLRSLYNDYSSFQISVFVLIIHKTCLCRQ